MKAINPRTIESFAMLNGKVGEEFYSAKKDNHLQSLAIYHNRKIKTERVIATSIFTSSVSTKENVGYRTPQSKFITLVTITH